MRIKERKGNILDASEQIIAHQVNCQGYMGKGIALQIRNKYPIVYQEYRKKVEPFLREGKESLLLGTIQFVKVEEDKWICNLFSQNKIGYNKVFTDYDALRTAFLRLKRVAAKRNKTIAIPKYIGCGLGGGDWATVYAILTNIFDEELTLYEL